MKKIFIYKPMMLLVALLFGLLLTGCDFITPIDNQDNVTITFDSNGGQAVNPVTVRAGSMVVLGTTTKDGYVFEGWYADANFNGPALTSFTAVASITLYAKWGTGTIIQYEVTFNVDGGSIIASILVNQGELLIKPNNPIKEGFIFIDWFVDSELTQIFDFTTPITEDITIYAKWVVDDTPQFTVTFNSNGGSLVEEQTIFQGSFLARPMNPTRVGYQFVDWYSDVDLTQNFRFDTPIIDHITLYAKWEEATLPQFTVTFNSNGGTAIAPQLVLQGDFAIRPTNPTWSGYQFVDWYSDAGLTQVFNFSTAITTNITLYAKWEQTPLPQFTVTFNSNGGSAVAPQLVLQGGFVVKPTNPTRSGYQFVDWYSDASLTQVFNFSTAITTNITLYAKWNELAAVTYTIQFVSNGGSFIAPMVANVNQVISAPEEPTRDRYQFRGWYTESELIYLFDFSKPITSNQTLYARWDGPIIYSFRVQFITNGGTPIEEQYIIENYLMPVPQSTRVGYTFENWYIDSTFSTLYDFSKPVTQEYILYANWVINSYDITYVIDEGIVEGETLDFDEEITLLQPTKAGYSFEGWYLDEAKTIPFSLTHMPANDIVLYARWVTSITDLEYVVDGDNITIIGYAGSSDELIMPNFIDGKPVTNIDDEAFLNNATLKTIYLSNHITTIGDYAFKNMPHLEALYLPNSATNIGKAILEGSNIIQMFQVSAEANYGLAYYFGDDDGDIPDSQFVVKLARGATNINPTIFTQAMKNAALEWVDDVTTIDDNLFANNTYIKHLIIPEGVKSIGSRAFENMLNLESIVIANSVETIHANILYNTPKLEKITVPFVGKTRTSLVADGVLGYFFGQTNVTGSTLVKQRPAQGYIDGLSFYISSSLREVVVTDATRISFGAFHNLTFVNQITLNEGVSVIDRYALSNTGAVEFEVPASVTLIDRYAFADNLKLEIVRFAEGSLLTIIEVRAFSNCKALDHMILPIGLLEIKESAFDSCSLLRYVFIPETVTKLEVFAFSNANNVVIYTEASSPKALWHESVTGTRDMYYDIESVEAIGDLVYAFSYDDYAIVVGVAHGSETKKINILSHIDGVEIIVIGVRAFADTFIEEVVFAENSNMAYIDGFAFYWMKALHSINIPDNLIEVGDSAFQDTIIDRFHIGSRLEAVGHKAFRLSEINTLTIAEDSILEFIGENAFTGNNITSVWIPNTVTYIGNSAFSHNYLLESFVFAEGSQLKLIPEHMLFRAEKVVTLSIPSSVEEISMAAFMSMPLLEEIYFEEDSALIIMGQSFAAGNPLLKSITIPMLVEEIGASAFNSCTSLEEVIFLSNDHLQFIGGSAFYGCESLQSIDIPDSVTTINQLAFKDCFSLTYAKLPASLTVISRELFYDADLHEIIIPKGVTRIIATAFGSNNNLSSVIFEEGNQLEEITTNAFAGTNIKEITIPSGVHTLGTAIVTSSLEVLRFEEGSILKTIPAYAFFNNPNLHDVVLPEGLETIEANAFGNTAPISTFGHVYNHVLTTVVIPSSVKVIQSNAFRNALNVSFYIEGNQIPTGFANLWNLREISSGVNDLAPVYFGYKGTSESGDLRYIEVAGNEVLISGIATGKTPTHLFIPRELDGLVVTGIADGSFINNTYIERITFAVDSEVTFIGRAAFENSAALSNLSLPASLETIKARAFYGCSLLRYTSIPENIVMVERHAFYASTNATILLPFATIPTTWGINWAQSTVIPNIIHFDDSGDLVYYVNADSKAQIIAITDVKNYVNVVIPGMIDGYVVGGYIRRLFQNQPYLETVIFSDDITFTTILDSTFLNCSNLTKVYIPLAITSYGGNIIVNCPNVTIYTPKPKPTFDPWQFNGYPVVWGVQSIHD